MFDVTQNRRKNLAKIFEGFPSLASFSKAIGRSPQQVSGMLNGAKPFGPRIARDIESILKLPEGSLDMEDPPSVGAPILEITDRLEREKQNVPSGHNVISIPTLRMDNQKDGYESLQTSFVEMLRVKTAWFFSQPVPTANPQALRVITAASDGMAPKIRRGDIVLIDTAQNTFTSNGIYAVEFANSLFFNRVQLMPDGRVLLKFENRDYDQITLEHPADVKVVGRALTVLNVHNL